MDADNEHGWRVEFYNFLKPPPDLVDEALASFGEIHERAARNGARLGMPIIIPPTGVLPDPRLNPFFRVSPMTGRKPRTWTVADHLAAFLRYMLDTSTAHAEAGFGTEWAAHSLTVQTGGLQPARGLFWHPAPGTTGEQDVWVHYGFTGTGMWISPAMDRWAVLLTNKLYYTRDRQPLTDVRKTLRQLAFA